ncbi:alpha/beta hydrolase [Nonomuraea sp. NPDC049784]|uniref:alpha/beta fold hydrolase n=1 Tax=Nonomuraea sp. NPDC049784 TaxID=3154361 RepID=UPI0033EE206A
MDIIHSGDGATTTMTRQPTSAEAAQQQTTRRRPGRRWLRRILYGLAGFLALVVAAALLVAYVWQPSQESNFRSAYLAGSSYVETPVARFHYVKTGSGSPIVLLPGGTLWIYSYRHTIPELAKHHTVYAVDLPGQGYTRVRDKQFRYDLDAMTDAVGQFMDAVGLKRASVVGHSWNGAVALYLAERHPERVQRLALLDSPGLDVPSSWDFRPLESPVVGELIGKLMTKSTYGGTLAKSFAHPDRLTDADIDEYWAPESRTENRMAMWMLQRNLDYTLTERRLGEVKVPTLILWGGKDAFDEPWQATELGRRIPGATVRIIPDAGHNVHEDAPTQANPILAAFLD